MKQLIFLFALLLTSGFTFAQAKLSDKEAAMRKELLVKFYGEEADKHVDELTASEQDRARIIWKTPISEQMYKLNGLDQYGSVEQFVGQPVGLLYLLKEQQISIPLDVYKSLSDFSREYLKKYEKFVKITD